LKVSRVLQMLQGDAADISLHSTWISKLKYISERQFESFIFIQRKGKSIAQGFCYCRQEGKKYDDIALLSQHSMINTGKMYSYRINPSSHIN
jgi:hypothetical protein